jgi:hypothetical protein
LVDTGADRTIFCANVFESFDLPATEPDEMLGGVGGMVKFITVETKICLTCDDFSQPVFRGQFAACIKYESLDLSVLGRDILDHFAVIIDRSNNAVCLLREQHSYNIMK